MTRRVRILERARKDIRRVLDWLDRRSPQGSKSWFDVLQTTFDEITDNPLRWPAISEATPRWRRDVREAFFKTSRGKLYRVVFEIALGEVRILRVRGSGQLPLRSRDLPRA